MDIGVTRVRLGYELILPQHTQPTCLSFTFISVMSNPNNQGSPSKPQSEDHRDPSDPSDSWLLSKVGFQLSRPSPGQLHRHYFGGRAEAQLYFRQIPISYG